MFGSDESDESCSVPEKNVRTFVGHGRRLWYTRMHAILACLPGVCPVPRYTSTRLHLNTVLGMHFVCACVCVCLTQVKDQTYKGGNKMLQENITTCLPVRVFGASAMGYPLSWSYRGLYMVKSSSLVVRGHQIMSLALSLT